jgi:putative DNA methylase
MSIEQNFDVPLIAALALKEKQIQQNYRPIIAVHKWFARRPGTLFRGLILAEFGKRALRDAYFESNDFPGRLIVDPFMGGGTPLIEANRVGCDVIGFDVNPMSAWIVNEEIEHIDIESYAAAAKELVASLETSIGKSYRTDCPLYGDKDVPVKYFIWVKVINCGCCGREFELFPSYLLATDSRHPRNVLICRSCGDLNEVINLHRPGNCQSCDAPMQVLGPARRNRCPCPHCGDINSYPSATRGVPRHRMVAIEYHNRKRKRHHAGRFFKKPDAADLARYAYCRETYERLTPKFVPDDEIPPGDETKRLHRWGYVRYRELFNARQLLGLELSCRQISTTSNERLRRALATNLSDLLRYQNMLCRYDATALKSLDIFSVHGFPVSLIQCESNLLGIAGSDGANVGSGGWTNVVEKYLRAKRYCSAPFEILRNGRKKAVISVGGEWIGDRRLGSRGRSVRIESRDSSKVTIKRGSVDAVFTDPPYFGNVQYGELMDFCYVWLRRVVGCGDPRFRKLSSRSRNELTGNATEGRDLVHFTDGLSAVYQRMALALKDDGPLVFTFHHNQPLAYHAVAVAILDAGFVCTAAIPCPAEMGGSIHIHGTGSSIVDTVFVCRKRQEPATADASGARQRLRGQIRSELDQLISAGLEPSRGDIRCIVLGHVTRLSILHLRSTWDCNLPTNVRLDRVEAAFSSMTDVDDLSQQLFDDVKRAGKRQRMLPLVTEDAADAVSF